MCTIFAIMMCTGITWGDIWMSLQCSSCEAPCWQIVFRIPDSCFAPDQRVRWKWYVMMISRRLGNASQILVSVSRIESNKAANVCTADAMHDQGCALVHLCTYYIWYISAHHHKLQTLLSGGISRQTFVIYCCYYSRDSIKHIIVTCQ